MKRILLAACLALGACTPGSIVSIPTAPSDVAKHTTADEQARLRCEQGYKLSRTLGELGVDAGLIKGQAATRAAAIDNKLFGALLACRAAYDAFNSASLIAAADEIDGLADQVQAIIKGDVQ